MRAGRTEQSCSVTTPMHNATGVHSHCIMHVRGQEAVVADGTTQYLGQDCSDHSFRWDQLPFIMCECTQTPVWKRERERGMEKSSIHPATGKFGKTGRK